jgi:phage-related protein
VGAENGDGRVEDLADDIADGIDSAIEWAETSAGKVGSIVRDGVQATFTLVDGVLKSVAYAVNRVIDGVTIAFQMVARTVVDIANAVWNVIKLIVDTVGQFVAFLFGLFDFKAFIKASDYMLEQLDVGMELARTNAPKIMDCSRVSPIGSSRCSTSSTSLAATSPGRSRASPTRPWVTSWRFSGKARS